MHAPIVDQFFSGSLEILAMSVKPNLNCSAQIGGYCSSLNLIPCPLCLFVHVQFQVGKSGLVYLLDIAPVNIGIHSPKSQEVGKAWLL